MLLPDRKQPIQAFSVLGKNRNLEVYLPESFRVNLVYPKNGFGYVRFSLGEPSRLPYMHH